LLFLGNDFGVDYVDRKYTPKSLVSDFGSNISRLQSSYRENSEKWWFWPINVVLAAIGFYFAAAMGVLALLYLPIPRGLIGTEWLTTQIAKFVAISPFLGRWILFIGYAKRVARQIDGRVNLAEGNNYQIPSENAKGSDLLDQVSNALSTRQFVLIEQSLFPAFPEYLTIRYLPPQSKGALLSGVLPILIPASEWRDSLSKTVSFVLKTKYGVPLDEEDMLKGQMERATCSLYSKIWKNSATNYQNSLAKLRVRWKCRV